MKKIVAKVKTYENSAGEKRGEYVRVGIIVPSSDGDGEYVLLDPSVNLAGAAMRQRINGNRGGDMLLCSVFEADQQQQSAPENSDDDIPF